MLDSLESLWNSLTAKQPPLSISKRERTYPYTLTPSENPATHFVFIVNPISGKGEGKKVMEEVEGIFFDENIKITVHLTERKGHARELAGSILLDEGIGGIIVVGGDGTFSEVVNGLLNDRTDEASVPVGIIPAGCGNAIAEEVWGSFDYVNIAEQITLRPLVKKNFPRVRYMDNEKEKFYYLCCFFSCGFLPNAIDKAEEWRWAGSYRYQLGFLDEFLTEDLNFSAQIVLDDKIIADGPLALFFGGRPLPVNLNNPQQKEPNLLIAPVSPSPTEDPTTVGTQITFVTFDTTVSGLDILQNLQRILTKQPGIEHPGIRWYRGKICDIRGGRKEGIAVDGEVGVVKTTPVRVEAFGKIVSLFGHSST